MEVVLCVWQDEVWICMELMATCLEKLMKQLKEPIPECILGKVAAAVRVLLLLSLRVECLVWTLRQMPSDVDRGGGKSAGCTACTVVNSHVMYWTLCVAEVTFYCQFISVSLCLVMTVIQTDRGCPHSQQVRSLTQLCRYVSSTVTSVKSVDLYCSHAGSV